MDILTVNDRAGAYPASYYAASAAPLPEFAGARGSLQCDVCVIGGGYTGLSAALHLAEKGYDVVLLEANRIGWGASGRNGGQVGSGQRRDQDALEKLVGHDHAHALWDLSCEARALVQSLIKTHAIACDYTPGIIHADHRRRFVADSHAYAEKLRRDYHYDQIHPLTKTEIEQEIGSTAYHGGTLDLGAGHLHPLQFAFGLALAAHKAGVRIFETSRVTSFTQASPAHVRTDRADIKAHYVVLACNGYLGPLEPSIAAKAMPINNFMIATEPLSDAAAAQLIRNHYAVADSRFVINYFRLSKDNRLLFGGGESYGYRFPGDIKSVVKKPMLEIFPHLKNIPIDYAWGGTLAITLNRMPCFCRIKGHILSVSGYSGHGLALSTLAGLLVARAIDGQAGAFDIMEKVPTPSFPGGMALRWPLLVLGMTWFALRDRL